MEIDIKGMVVDSEDGAMLNWFGVQNTNPQDIQKALKDADGKDISLNIASTGGDVFAAAEIYTMFKQYPGQVTGTIQGTAASAASIIAESCQHLVISPAASMMIHRASTDASGNTDVMGRTGNMLSKIDQTLVNVYQSKTGKSRDDILALMKAETWLTAQDAVDQGFADEILDVNATAPQVVNAVGTIPNKAKVQKFLNMLAKEKTDNKEESNISNQETRNIALFKSKLAILKGENNGN